MRAPLQLTAHHRTVCIAIANGKSTKEIAAQMCISERTVKHHISNALRRLGFRPLERGRIVLGLHAIRRGWVF